MRIEPPKLEHLPWQTAHGLRFADLDPIQHVNNGAYTAIMEDNRARLFMNRTITAEQPALFSMARYEIDFVAELGWPNEVIAASGIETIGNSSIRLRQAIFAAGRCAAHAHVILVAIGSETRRPVAIGAELREFLMPYFVATIAAK